MIARNEIFRKKMALAVVLFLTLSINGQAQTSGVEEVYDLDQIDIEGNWDKRESVSKKMEKMRKDLETKTNDAISKKIEDERIKSEIKLAKKLKKAFNNGIGAINSVGSDETSKTIVESTKRANTKIIPSFGYMNYQSDKIDFDSKISTGLSIEAMVTERISVGIGFNYTNMKIYDIDNNYAGYGNHSYSGYSSYGGYYPSYNSGYGNAGYGYMGAPYQDREIDFKRASVNLNSKFFLVARGTIRPFLGGAVSYNRTKLQYNDDGFGMYYMYNDRDNEFGGEEYATSYVSGSVILGSEIQFTKTFGLNLDFRYTKGITSGHNIDANAHSLYYNPDLERLQNVGEEMEEASNTSINLGVIVAF